MDMQKLAAFGILITVIAIFVLTLLITNSTQNARSPPSVLAPSAITAIAETSLSNASNSTNATNQAHNPQNLTFSPSTHPPTLTSQNKSALEQAQKNRLHSPPLPLSGEPIHAPAPGTASP